jgi:hypothetical protein
MQTLELIERHEMKTQSEAKIVAGAGRRWTAWQFPNGRFGVKDNERACQTLAAGLDEADAVESVNIANDNDRWHHALIFVSVRENRASHGFSI